MCVLWRDVGSSTALSLRWLSLVKARVRAGRSVTQALSEPLRCRSEPLVRAKEMSTAESGSVTQAFSKSLARISEPPAQEEVMSTAESASVTRALCELLRFISKPHLSEKKGCRPLRVVQATLQIGFAHVSESTFGKKYAIH